MLLNALESADGKTVFGVAGHHPAIKNGAQAGVVGQKRSGAVVLVRIALGTHDEALRLYGGEELPQLIKAVAHPIGCCAFIPQREEERLLEFFLFGKEL